MKPGKVNREQLKKHLFGGEAFMTIEELLKKIPFEQIHLRPKGLPYSFYELFYHIFFTQRDILHYCLKQDYQAPVWPNDYWPKQQAPGREESWRELQENFFEDREALGRIIVSHEKNLGAQVPSGKDHSIFRELLLVIEHTAYHTGQLVIILRQLGLHSSRI
ncbi:DinB family protein [Salinimicrobium sp. CDJ15-81-2]|nr:DinB family protein [Salinimicrobium nanhaiense]